MVTMHCTSRALLTGAFGAALHRSSTLPPSFLVPCLASKQPASPFSTTTPLHARKDGNPSGGVSALRHTGPGKRQKLRSITPSQLPQPVRDPERRTSIVTDPDHGLWGFFNKERTSMPTPMDLVNHGRGWKTQELRGKDWEDLHRLWWVCVKEVNRLQTFLGEKRRVGSMYGDFEAEGRMKVIYATQNAIREVLTQRFYAWENARVAAMDDEEVNLYADPEKGEQAYVPREEPEQSEAEANEGTSLYSPPPPQGMSRGPEARI
ncbi:54S ribosomal protein L4 mitochondrial [Vermiconidia calcicola]|uniref:54S ribosomal protein L4 mitochondrial n=1 Tax=Vermiconidia calcicola TaxID=1690605 RepID=A0ACC3MXG3_9PEZI|nr:54S ribosomal protein L4 mitochondrial [Vermiconidia calcicola]